MIAPLARIATVPELAAEIGVPTHRMRRRLKALHKKHGGGWLFRLGLRDFGVNRSMLKAAHPELFEKKLATQAELETLRERIKTLEQRQSALAAKFREQSHTWFKQPRSDAKGQP